MVITAILYILYYAIYALLSVTILLLDDVVVNVSLTAAINTVVSYMAVLNAVLPIDTIFQIFLASIAIFIAVAIYRLVLWVIRIIRG